MYSKQKGCQASSSKMEFTQFRLLQVGELLLNGIKNEQSNHESWHYSMVLLVRESPNNITFKASKHTVAQNYL